MDHPLDINFGGLMLYIAGVVFFLVSTHILVITIQQTVVVTVAFPVIVTTVWFSAKEDLHRGRMYVRGQPVFISGSD